VPLIELCGLTKTYQEGDHERVVFQSADATIRRGEFVALLGRSGSGKSTLLNLGTLVSADGSTRSLTRDEVQLEVLDHWQSPRDGARYPSRWYLRIPTERLELEITPYLNDQELDVLVRYWEGAVRVHGTGNSQPLRGNGYVELTGYSDVHSRRS